MRRIYLDNAATSLVHPRVLEVPARFVELISGASGLSTSDVTRAQRASLVQARQTVAELLGCSREEISLVQSTSHALGILVECLPLTSRDNVLICDLEYQASVVCWKRRQEEVGFELRQVTTSDGCVSVEDFRRCIDENTRVILLAAVQEINGFRADVAAIGKLAREYGCYYIVDGIQEAGALQVNVRQLDMDFYCAGGKKWLGNPYGMGFLYIKGEHLGTLRPGYHSYYDIQVPEQYGDYMSYLEDPRRHPFDDYVLPLEASCFETGGYGNFIGAMGLTEAIGVLQEQGMVEVEARIRALVRRLLTGLEELDITPCSPTDEAHLSPIVSFNFGLRDNSVEKERQLLAWLQEQGIYVSLRCSTGTGGVRVSVHYYTQEEEIDAFLRALRAFMEREDNS